MRLRIFFHLKMLHFQLSHVAETSKQVVGQDQAPHGPPQGQNFVGSLDSCLISQVINHHAQDLWCQRPRGSFWFAKAAADRAHQQRDGRTGGGAGQPMGSMFVGNSSDVCRK
jgi:hypothetical protein